jgi:hypothetical protein
MGALQRFDENFQIALSRMPLEIGSNVDVRKALL